MKKKWSKCSKSESIQFPHSKWQTHFWVLGDPLWVLGDPFWVLGDPFFFLGHPNRFCFWAWPSVPKDVDKSKETMEEVLRWAQEIMDKETLSGKTYEQKLDDYERMLKRRPTKALRHDKFMSSVDDTLQKFVVHLLNRDPQNRHCRELM